jgi:selenocysteine-specific elongation factor
LKSRLGDGSSLTLVFFDSVLEQLVAEKKIAIAQDVVHEYGRTVTLKADEERIRGQLAERFQKLGLQVDTANEIIAAIKVDRTIARKLIQLMLKENVLVKISEDMFVDRSIMDKLIADVRALKSQNPKFGVGEFKNLTGVTRKHAIPLLEYLDRQRVTKRVGDERMIL